MPWDGRPKNPQESDWHFIRYTDGYNSYNNGDVVSESTEYNAVFWDKELKVWALPGWEPDGCKPDEMAQMAEYFGAIFPSYLFYGEDI